MPFVSTVHHLSESATVLEIIKDDMSMDVVKFDVCLQMHNFFLSLLLLLICLAYHAAGSSLVTLPCFPSHHHSMYMYFVLLLGLQISALTSVLSLLATAIKPI
jgi:hypothetical protein